MASGKSTVSSRLGAALGAEVLSADELRGQLFEQGVDEAYRPGFSRRLYPDLLARARGLLQGGHVVVLDGTFRSHALRAEARGLAAACGAGFLFVECRASAETCRARLRARERAEGRSGWLALFEGFLGLWEPVEELPEREHLVVDTGGLVDSLDLAPVFAALQQRS